MAEVLGINDYKDVYVAIKPVSAQWMDLGTRLGVTKPTLDIIEANHKEDVVRCLSEMINKWLKRDLVDGAAIPTWRNLCIALSPIDGAQAEIISEEHGCDYINPAVSEVVSRSSVPPAFLPQSCGCGQCTIQGWKSGRVCQSVYVDDRPKLLVVNPANPQVTELIQFEKSYDRQARLSHETSYLIECFKFVCMETWTYLKQAVDVQACNISDIVLKLSSWLNKSLPMIANLKELQDQFHFLRVSWLNFRPLHFLADQFLSKRHPDLMTCWSNYRNVFKEYCTARNLKSYANIFFQLEEQNIFLLEIDDIYRDLTLSDIKGMQESLCLALNATSVCFHLLTIRKGCLVIYFYYCFSDYLSIFKSLTEKQLKMISEIKAYKILSLTDLHNEFRYDNIQSYNEDLNTVKEDHAREGDDDAELRSLRKLSRIKDIELVKTIEKLKEKDKELFIAHQKLRICTGDPLRTIHLNAPHYHAAVCDSGVMVATKWNPHDHGITVLNKVGKAQNFITDIQLNFPCGVVISADEYILVADNHSLQKFTFDGVCVKSVGGKENGSGELQFNQPKGIAVNPTTGQVFVADSKNNRIQVFKADLTFLHTIILENKQKFSCPRDVALDNEGHLYVAEEGNCCITKLTSSGEYLKRFGTVPGKPKQLIPAGVTASGNLVYVSEQDHHEISVFNTQGEFLYCFGSKGNGPGEYKQPWGMTIDSKGFLYICDCSVNSKIDIY